MGKIPRAKVDEVQAVADIVEVATPYVSGLKRSGSSYRARCPFHNGKSNSFSLSPDKNVFHCFSCGKSGDIVTFVQEMEGLSFVEAVRLLAGRFGVALPEETEEENEEAARREAVRGALRFAARFFYHQLTRTDVGKPALRYLREERGLTPQTVKSFGLGYAPDGWDALLRAAHAKNVNPETLEEAGLVIARKEGDGYYDRYRGRVIFPILSRVGHVLGFAGRILHQNEDAEYKQPKYINSPETSVYHKSRVLYGLHQAKAAIRREGEVYIVEGYTDVIALHQAGIEHTVATCGTSLTEEQVQLLSRYAERVVLLYDADQAGDRATARGIDAVLAGGLTAYAVTLPEGTDPDVFAREKGPEALKRQLRKRQDVAAFHRAQAERDGTFGTAEGSTAVAHAVVRSLALIPDGIARKTHLKSAIQALDMQDMHEELHRELERVLEERRRQSERRAAAPRPSAPLPDDPQAPPAPEEEARRRDEEASAAPQGPEPLPPERNLLHLMLEHGRPMVEFILGHMALDEFTEGPARRMAEHFLEMYEAETVEPRRFVEGELGEDLQRLAASVMLAEEEPSENWAKRLGISVPRLNADPRQAAASSMMRLRLRRVDEALRRTHAEQVQAGPTHDEAALRRYQERVMRLLETKKQIERGAFLEWHEA